MVDFALGVAFNTSQAKSLGFSDKSYRVAYISPNGDSEALIKRMIFSQARVSNKSIIEGFYNEERDAPKLVGIAGKLCNDSFLKFYTSSFSSYTLNHHCLRLQEKEGLDLVVLDRLQSLNDFGKSSGESGYSRGLEIKHSLKEMSSSGLTLLVLSEVKKKRNTGEPLTSDDLRDMAILEYDASPILLFDKPIEYESDDFGRDAIPIQVRIKNNFRGFYMDDVAFTYLTAFGRYESAAKVDYDEE